MKTSHVMAGLAFAGAALFVVSRSNTRAGQVANTIIEKITENPIIVEAADIVFGNTNYVLPQLNDTRSGGTASITAIFEDAPGPVFGDTTLNFSHQTVNSTTSSGCNTCAAPPETAQPLMVANETKKVAQIAAQQTPLGYARSMDVAFDAVVNSVSNKTWSQGFALKAN